MLKREQLAEPTTPLAQTKRPRDSLGGSLQDLRTPLKNVTVSNSPSLDFISPRRPGEEDEERRRNRAELVKRQQESRESLKSPSAGASPRAELPSSTLKRLDQSTSGSGSSPASVSTTNLTAQGTRSILTASKSRLSISSTKLSTTQPPLALTAEQMTKSFDEWMKMAADNKINSKNSWNFALIDYFSELTFLRDGDSINFQKASCTLDGCVKIYASRVDSVVDETTKLLNGLSDKSNKFKSLNDSEEQEQESEDQIDDVGKQKSAKTLKKTSMRTIETIEKNPDNLILKNFDLEFSIDPLFKKTSAEFDESGSKGALLKNLECSPVDNLIIFDSSDQIPMDFGIPPDQFNTNSPEEEETIDISLFNSIFGSLIIDLDTERSSLCPTFDDYNFNIVNIKETLEKLSRISPNVPVIEPQQQVTEVEVDIDPLEDDEDDHIKGFDDHMPFMPDDDGFFEDQEDQLNSYNQEQPSDSKSVKWATTNEVTDETGLSYFDGAFKQTWAGPEHWKIRKSQRISNAPQQTTSINNNQNNTKSRRTSKTEKVSIDFISSVIDFRQIFSKPTSAGQISLTKSAILERNEQDHLLPDDLHFSSASLLKLFIKPNWKPSKSTQKEQKRITRSSNKSNEQLAGNFIERDFWISQESHQNGIYNEQPEKDEDEETDFYNKYDDDDRYEMDNFNEIPNANQNQNQNNDDNFFSNYENDELQLQREHHKAITNVNNENINNSYNSTDNLAVDFNKNLVAAPKFTHVPQLNYARVAKRVDVAKLKSTLWNEFIEETKNISKSKNQDPVSKEEITPKTTNTFSTLINNLSKTYKSDALAEVSVPYCFICLLHLANEKNLDIQSKDNDLIIRN